jgi:hypothetical protein
VNLVLSEDESGTLEVHQELVLCSDITGANSAARSVTVAGLTTVRRVLLKTEGALSLWPGVSEGIEIRVPNVKLTTANEGFWKTDASGGILSTDLVTAFSLTGYTILERTWAESEDGAVATLILLAGKATWAKTFAADKVEMARRNPADWAIEEVHQVRGVAKADISTLQAALLTAETGRVVTAITIEDMGNGALAGRREQEQAATSLPTARIVKLQEKQAHSPRRIVQQWNKMNTATKDLAVAAALANLSYTWPSEQSAGTYGCELVLITDHGNGSWSVAGHRYDTSGGAVETGEPYFEKHIQGVVHIQTREKDDATRTWTLWLHVCGKRTRKQCWDFIENLLVAAPGGSGYTTHKILHGSESVKDVGKMITEGRCHTFVEVGGIGVWTGGAQ